MNALVGIKFEYIRNYVKRNITIEKDTNFADTSIPKYLNIILYTSTRWKKLFYNIQINYIYL